MTFATQTQGTIFSFCFLKICFKKWAKKISNSCKIVDENFGKNWVIFSAEWTYLLTTRKVGGEDSAWSFVRIQYGSNATDTVSGTLIYPDDFSFSEAGVASLAFARKPSVQINAADWAALEEAGCVFLPGARACEFKADIWTFGEVETGVLWHYQTCTAASAANSNVIRFNPLANGTTNPHVNFPNYGRNLAFPVRLAQDVK